MRVTVLGCNGSISGNLRTTCYRVDDDILVDAGTGAADLTLQQLLAINTVFLTHSHLDHCALLPMLADAAGNFRDTPLAVHALPETIAALKEHMLNGKLWPDYTALPSPERPYLCFKPLSPGETVELQGRRITALPARHAVPGIAYQVDSGAASWVYSGDTTFCEEFWQALNRIVNLQYLLVETTCLNRNAAGAARSGHMTAELLAQGLRLLRRPVELLIVHMEAGREADTLREVLQAAGEFNPQALQRGREFVF
ncbi:MAG: 3',5'-cyclic-nucleotide phosphodiesterase [Nitrosomonadales bacterium]|nr:3',5'-cyclic-nucleotide phosphodiesterase [Nitrosomonadales bacterium]